MDERAAMPPAWHPLILTTRKSLQLKNGVLGGTGGASARWLRNEFTPSGPAMTEPEHISTNDARAGSTPHMTRYILGWGLALVIVAFVILLFVWR